MADEKEAVIRRASFPEDDKLFRLFVGKSCMEPLAIANRRFTTSRTAIAIWLAVASVIVNFMGWWPDPSKVGWMGYARPLPAYAVSFLPLVFCVDWYVFQRPYFEEQSVTVLKRPDVVNKETYYSRSPASGIWILEFGKTFVGLAAVDASKDSLSNDTIMERDDAETRQRYAAKGTATTATIRHFYVVEQFRTVGIQDDLLSFALKRAFESSPNVQNVRMTPSPMFDYLDKMLKKAGFTVVEQGKGVGLGRWPSLTYELSRESWKSRTKS
ncbi:hypothetical protein SCHPADRAFT_826396 [Schizopora paradoxa]|uniref:N-acetyltransferase domain-containing protein n=1 Tax=Schizopora paradoxa TaxID=27342 RepID=A0A0H2SC25_9AGAM|nr:hypothetical protein SCHPADRAFT_826396 [Schizopora paradoxa]